MNACAPPPPPGVDVAALAREVGARHGGHPVRLHETHLSWVLLCADRAYKLKKPVRFGFVDFLAVAARRAACEEELRLNERLAPGWSLDVLPVTGAPDAPVLGGAGAAIDHVLRMRRFPDGSLFDERLATGRLQAAHVERLAGQVAAFHLGAPHAAPGTPYGTPETLEATLAPLWRALVEARTPGASASLATWLAAQARRLRPTWAARRAAGFVREGHGDLHLANAFATDDGAVAAFDGIEFDPSLRWIDVVNDVAFMVMDLLAHARADLAFGFLDRWLADTGDHAGLAVLRHALVARALVRARVAALPGAARAPGRPDYLALARSLCHAPAPRLVLMHGLSGAGKSHLAASLLGPAHAVRLRSDVERKRLFGLAPTVHDADRAQLYGAAATARTHEALIARTRFVLEAGWTAIVDATLLRRAERERFAALAHALALPCLVVRCTVPEAVAAQRIAERERAGSDASDAGRAVLAAQRTWLEPLDPAEGLAVVDVDTTERVDAAGLWSCCLRLARLPDINSPAAPKAKNGCLAIREDPR